ncbi:MAG TPA: TlpA disulfide reductase family protein [Chitinophagaceae bacterium]
MRKIALFGWLAACLFLSVETFAKDRMTLISGQVNRENAVSVFLYKVVEGKRTEYASTRLDGDKAFAFALPSVKEGFYYLADQRKNSYIRIYLTAGEKLELQLTEEGYEVIKGSKENKLLHDWSITSQVVTAPAFNWMKDSCTYLSYFPKLESALPQLQQYKEKIKTKNKHFNELMKMAVETDVEHAAMYFLLTPNTVHPKKEQYPSFYRQIIQPAKYKSAQLLEMGDALELLSRYATFNVLMNPSKERPKNMLEHNASLFGNDTIKGAFIANSLRYKTFEELEEAVKPVKQYLLTDSMQAAYFRAMKAVADFKKGSPSYNFAYEDINGKKVSMTDLKGKVVLVDVWATWCGPCKVEIPHLKKLEEEFEGKKVEFVSISVDVEKDKEKWKNFVAEKALGGTQLFASGWSDITKYYDITGIPRFLVFDQEGKIVTANAPRPSEPELKTLLENTLQGK